MTTSFYLCLRQVSWAFHAKCLVIILPSLFFYKIYRISANPTVSFFQDNQNLITFYHLLATTLTLGTVAVLSYEISELSLKKPPKSLFSAQHTSYSYEHLSQSMAVLCSNLPGYFQSPFRAFQAPSYGTPIFSLTLFPPSLPQHCDCPQHTGLPAVS